jgi:hypothetical protein
VAKEKEALKTFIHTNLEDRKIRPSDSPYASSFFFRSKQGTTKLRGIQDYWKLNEITIKDRYPLPLISEVIQNVQGSAFYMKMDLRWRFNNIRICESDEQKATFITPAGLFEPTVMQFGLCNAPSTFQRMVDEVLAEEKASGCVTIYIDDILIHTWTKEENRSWTRQVLEKLSKNKLYCRKSKCTFEQEEAEFLGITIRQGMVRMSKKKTEAITKEQPLKTRRGLRCFLGMTNYHQKFIKNYSSIARPLHELTKDIPFLWTNSCQNAFEKLRGALTDAPVLPLPSDEGKFWLETDTSDVATGTVLYQMQTDGDYKPVSYASKSYNDSEKNYKIYNKEMLGVMRGLEEWRNLLIGAAEPFEILIDHRNLTYFHEPQKLTARQVNWTTKLQDYNFVIKHIEGGSNAWADALSRPENVHKEERKTDTLLLDQFFIWTMVKEDALEEAPTTEEKSGFTMTPPQQDIPESRERWI